MISTACRLFCSFADRMRSFGGWIIILAVVLQMGCTSAEQRQIRSALEEVGGLAQASEVRGAYDALMSEEPSLRWICLSVVVARNVLERVELSDGQRKAVVTALGLAEWLCPQILAVLPSGS